MEKRAQENLGIRKSSCKDSKAWKGRWPVWAEVERGNQEAERKAEDSGRRGKRAECSSNQKDVILRIKRKPKTGGKKEKGY